MVQILQGLCHQPLDLIEIHDKAVLSHLPFQNDLHLVGVAVHMSAFALIAGKAVCGIKLCNYSQLHSPARPLRLSISSS